jgi:hypothetical protein
MQESKEIIGKTIKISNIEVAENDFPKTMFWYDAKVTCTKLGDGWRLPTKEELNILYLNKDIIGGFTDNFYWSSIDGDNDFREVDVSWGQSFDNGNQRVATEFTTGYFRAVRFSNFLK